MRLSLLAGRFAVCRLDPDAAIPPLALDVLAGGSSLACVARTPKELSVLCPEEKAPSGARIESGWRALEVEGPLPFGLTGVMSSITSPLAQAGVSVFAVSTFDTDYVLVKEDKLARAALALRGAGFELAAT